MSETILPITGLPVGKVPSGMLVCGDPARATRISEQFDNPSLLSEKREYRTYVGTYRGVPVGVCSHGVGAPGAAAGFEELIAAGAKRLIRVGTCGGMQPDLAGGSLVITTAAVQHTGYGREMVPAGFPAVADLDLTLALRHAAAEEAPAIGIVLTRDGFYAGLPTAIVPDYATLSAAGVQAVEMECAALFLVATLRRVAASGILVVDGNVLQAPESMDSYQPHTETVAAATGRAIRIALDAIIT